MDRIISKKLQIDQNNDSLLQQPMMKKFIGVSQKILVNPSLLTTKQKLNIKYLQPQIDVTKNKIRRRIISMSPSQTRISFFTKYNQSRLLDTNTHNPQQNKKFQIEGSRSQISKSSKIVSKLFQSTKPRLNFIKRRLSMGTLKPKTQVEKIVSYRRKNLMENPFRDAFRDSDYI